MLISGEKDMHKLLLVLAMFAVIPCLFAEDPHCKQVGGAISTNFLDPSNTLGSATGTFKGGIGVSVLKVTPGAGQLVFHNQHHWVTESGDTISLQDADAIAQETADPTLVAIRYKDGVQVTGGTGEFANARGTLAIWGAADLARNEIVLRYEGQVCFGR
jgi:hypothetical protein